MYRFEKLRVYHDAMDLVQNVYQTTRLLPQEERFVLVDQLRRSVISIVLNIAEGSGGLGDKEYQSFLRNALKSLYETVAGLMLSQKMYHLNISIALEKCDLVGKELNALIKYLKSKD